MRIAITAGDPRGIGPEIIIKALADPRVRGRCDFVVVAPDGCGLIPQEKVGAWKTGGSPGDAGQLAGMAITRAVELAQSGEVAGIVTAPLDKGALLAGGYDFPGHTEMLASLTGSRVAMMLASDSTAGGSALRVVLATTHIALRDVPAAIASADIAGTAEVTRRGLTKWFGIAEPRIAMCALNPHGGESGRFGDEDTTVLEPAAKRAGIAGPFPADTVFVRAMRGEFDAVIAPYHDVGMTAIKVAAFGKAVNVTLGLPFPRTSPDHGTALDIAGKGTADPSSFIEALLLCCRIAEDAPPRAGHRGYADPQQAHRSSGLPSREQ